MTAKPMFAARRRAHVEFLSGDDVFAAETLAFDVKAGENAEATAATAAEASHYYDERVPDLRYRLQLDPDETSSEPGEKPVCKSCGADRISRDACLRWDIETQSWELSGLYDSVTCDLCGAESDSLANWIPADRETATERFVREVAARLGRPELAGEPHFEQVVLDHFVAGSFDGALAAWSAAEARNR